MTYGVFFSAKKELPLELAVLLSYLRVEVHEEGGNGFIHSLYSNRNVFAVQRFNLAVYLAYTLLLVYLLHLPVVLYR